MIEYVLIVVQSGLLMVKIDVVCLLNLEDSVQDHKKCVDAVSYQKGDFEFTPLMPYENSVGPINEIIESGKSPYIAFMDSASVWHSMKTEIQSHYLESYDLITCNTLAAKDSIEYISNMTDLSTWIMHRDVFKAIGGFNEDLKVHHPSYFLGQMMKMGDTGLGMKRLHITCGTPNDNIGEALNSIAGNSDILSLQQHIISQPLVSKLKKVKSDSNEAEFIYKQFGVYPW